MMQAFVYKMCADEAEEGSTEMRWIVHHTQTNDDDGDDRTQTNKQTKQMQKYKLTASFPNNQNSYIRPRPTNHPHPYS
jgi:hypothetical protein